MAINFSEIWPSFLLTIVVAVVGHFLYSGYKVRARVNRLRKQGLTMPPWSWTTGHLPFFRAQLANYPPNVLISVVMKDIAQKYFPETEMYYLDLWPMLPPTLWVGHAPASIEVDRRLTTKPDVYKGLFQPMTGGATLLDTNGRDWRYWRGLMSAGFAPGYVMSKVGEFVDSGNVFCDVLEKHAKEKDVFQLEVISMRFTLESIVKIALDLDLHHQINPHPVVKSLLAIMPWVTVGNPLEKFHPVRPFILAHYNRIINYHMVPALEDKYAQYKSDPTSKQSDSIFTIALNAHAKNYPEINKKMDSTFRDIILYQIRMFLVAGHDTTTSVLVYCYHILHKHPEAMARMREEHEKVFGSDLSATSALLKENPALLNSIPYTVGVIKETMRLFPPGGAFRSGSPDVQLLDRNGTQYPTEGCHVSVAHHTLHYSPNIYPDPEKFQPERWIDKGVEKGAWRPFERGPRNCMGQDVAMLQLKAVLALTARKFKVSPAYEEWDEMEKRKGGGWLWKTIVGADRLKKREVNGDRAYQAEAGGARPAMGYPCRVELVDEKAS